MALVTGGVHGLGRAVCIGLAGMGADVAVNFRTSAADADRLCRDLEDQGVRARAFRADLADVQAATALVLEVEASFGRLDILVCAAGPFRRPRVPIAEAERDAAAWQAMAAGNVAGSVAAIAAALPGMRRRRFGRIFTFGMDRVGEATPWPGRAAYAAAKAALWSYTQSVAREEVGHGITAHMVAPGNIVDPWKEGTITAARAVAQGGASGTTPVGRPGTGEDVARVIQFLAHPDSDFLTATLTYVGGGEEVVVRPEPAWEGDGRRRGGGGG